MQVPDFTGTNIDYWFKPYIIKELAIIKNQIDETFSKDEDIHDFFKICFSATVREVSGTRKGEYKLYRMPKDKWEKYRPDIISSFIKNVDNSIRRMSEFFEKSNRTIIKK